MEHVRSGLRAAIRWLGWWGFIGLIIVAAGLIAWWGWEQARQLPLPPQAQNVSSEILGALARKTTFVVPAPSAEVRAFYRETLPQRGWAYCGTQATPGCTNLIPAADGSGDQVDVFRRADDQDASGTTIEIWLAENPRGGTVVSILEANPSR